MYVSKDLALILKEKENSMCKDLDYSNTTNESLIDWIFDNLTACDINDALLDYDINQLKFWYTTLLEHKFGLMHEFIGRLEEWFESNGYYINVANRYNKKGITINDRVFSVSISHKKYHNESDYNTIRFLKLDIETKQQAKHEGIMKCFELLKTNGDEE